MDLQPCERTALDLYRQHRRKNPSGIASDSWLQTAEAVTLADAMLRLFPEKIDAASSARHDAETLGMVKQVGSVDRGRILDVSTR